MNSRTYTGSRLRARRAKDLDVVLRNVELAPGQRAQIFESGVWVDAASIPVTVPAGDAVAVHVK